jgi:hypothetical protein
MITYEIRLVMVITITKMVGGYVFTKKLWLILMFLEKRPSWARATKKRGSAQKRMAAELLGF